MKRIIWHWTAGGHKANAVDRAAYHVIIEGDGNIVWGDHPVSANENISDGYYARHTKNLNTGSIGIALAGMHDAEETPFIWGPYPLTEAQIDGLVDVTVGLSRRYEIPVSPQTMLTHAEVEPTLGVKQRNKWDITVLPGMTAPADPIIIGNTLRQRVRAKLKPPEKETPLAALCRALRGGK